MPLEKVLTGVPGLDEILHGGLPSGRITLIAGDAGTGKTLLALQCLVGGARSFHEPGIFVAFEELAEELAINVEPFGWRIRHIPPLSIAEDDAVISVLEANLSLDVIQEGEFDIAGLLAGLDAACALTGARRVVFDGLNVLLDLLEDPRHRQREIARIGAWTRRQGITTIITAREFLPDVTGKNYGFLRYVASCVLSLSRSSISGTRDKTIQVEKMRGSSHSSGRHSLMIRERGVRIGHVGAARRSYDAPEERISSGVGRLDALLGGGFHRSSSILISGAPGTAKTTLAGAFVEAACRRGERALFVSFDEAFSQVERNLASVNINLRPHSEAGLLRSAAWRAGYMSGEEYLHEMVDLLDQHRPSVIVVDPVSALDKNSGEEVAGEIAERLIDEAKTRGMTVLLTSLLQTADGLQESTKIQISSIADTWIHLSFTSLNGERNRALTVIKSRGNAHSNQVRELLLTERGPTLADIYAHGGAVLMGTARHEREEADRLAEAERQRRALLAEEELNEQEKKLKARRQELDAELRALQARRSAAVETEQLRIEARSATASALLHRRDGSSSDAKDDT